MYKPLALLSLLSLTACGGGARTIGTLDLELSAADLATLIVEHGAGDLTIAGSPDADEITATVELVAFGSDERDEDAVRAMIATLEPEDGAARLVVRFEEPAPGYALPTRVLVPRALLLDVLDGEGDLSIDEVSGLVLVDGSGDTVVQGIATDVFVDDGSGDLTIANVGGAVDVIDGSGDLSIEDVDGAVRIDDGSGDIDVVDVQGDLDVVDGSGDMDLQQVRGHATIIDGSGDIRVEGVDSWEILADGSGDIIEN
jgi:hypothetical protein